MNHLDEGTIHAWLDGALDTAQSAEVEQHVATCASCAEAVAEARGIMAAASGIMRALDDDRVNVIPKAPADPAVTPLPRAKPVRRTAPWVFGIAAVLLAAVVLQTSVLERDLATSESATLVSAPAGGDAGATPALPPPAIATETQQAPLPPQPVARAREASSPRVANPVQPKAATSVASAPTEVVTVTSATVGSVAGTAAGAARQELQAEAGRRALQDEARLRQRLTAPASAPAVAETQLRSVPAAIDLTDATPAGCYAVRESVAQANVATGAGVKAQRAARRDGRAASAPASAAAVADRADFAASTRVVRVDTATNELSRVVRAVPSDSVIGSWRLVGDSLRLDLGGAHTLSVPRSARVACPSP